MFSDKVENHKQHIEAFQRQLIQHNLRIIEKYYDKIKLERVSELLSIPIPSVEKELCAMIFEKVVYARIDRLTNIVTFKRRKNENEVLNEWTADVHKLLALMDSTCNLINREHEVHGIQWFSLDVWYNIQIIISLIIV